MSSSPCLGLLRAQCVYAGLRHDHLTRTGAIASRHIFQNFEVLGERTATDRLIFPIGRVIIFSRGILLDQFLELIKREGLGPSLDILL